MQIINPGESPRKRALIQALEEVQEAYDATPITSKNRARLASKIVELEDALTALGEG